jgi:SAM-dependent methyltransferase
MGILLPHEECINLTLRDISERYKNKKRLLDIGCGSGERTLLFNVPDRELIGCDRINWLCEEAKEKIHFLEEDILKGVHSFREKSFDIIFNFDVIEHLPNPAQMLKDACRLIKDDGIFVISTPNRNRIFNFILLSLGIRHFPLYPTKENMLTDPFTAHIKEYTVPELEMILYKFGFRVIKTQKIFYGHRSGFKTFYGLPFFHNIIMECMKVKGAEKYFLNDKTDVY